MHPIDAPDPSAALLMPLEHLRLPETLDGTFGSNRQRDVDNQLGAQDDLTAIRLFLNEYLDSPATYRSYKKEIERLLLWSVVEQGKPLSSLTREDFSTYAEFLRDPQPRARWCGPRLGRSGRRFTANWRPFVGPLGPAARKTALVVINSLLNYLVQARYLHGNPLALMRQRHRVRAPESARRDILQRTLDDHQWNTVVETLEALPRAAPHEQAHYERLRFILALLHFLALRVGEIDKHTMGDFMQVRGRWVFYVTGKGDKDADIPVNSAMLQALMQYRTFLGLAELPLPHEPTPLVLDLAGRRGITARRINQVLKELVNAAAENLAATDPAAAASLRRASAHWFRHTSLTRQAERGIPLAYLKANARHSKVDTTMLYIHTDDQRRHTELEKLTWR